jgi:hypothetical protein
MLYRLPVSFLKKKVTIILSVALYGYENWSLPGGEEHRLVVSENRVLRRIFGPRKVIEVSS